MSKLSPLFLLRLDIVSTKTLDKEENDKRRILFSFFSDSSKCKVNHHDIILHAYI